MGRLTTHVLDTAAGRPASGLRIDLFSLDDGRRLLKSVTTNADGRADAPLAENDAFRAGTYELLFHCGDYFRRTGIADCIAPVSRRGAGALWYRRSRSALSCAAPALAVVLFDLPGELDHVGYDPLCHGRHDPRTARRCADD